METFILYLDRMFYDEIEPVYTLSRIRKGREKKKMIIYSLRTENGGEIKTSDPEEVTKNILIGYRLVDAYEIQIMENKPDIYMPS